MDDQLRIFSFEEVRVDKSSLMPQELIASAKVFWEHARGLFFNNMPHISRDPIPKFAFTFVDIIDC